jgi:hypothetical protein
VANSAIRVVGRLDPAEARRDEYGFLPAVARQRSTILKPGSMYVAQPRLPVPLLVEFPFPSWATRPAEAQRGDGGDRSRSSGGRPGADTDPTGVDGAQQDPFADLTS